MMQIPHTEELVKYFFRENDMVLNISEKDSFGYISVKVKHPHTYWARNRPIGWTLAKITSDDTSAIYHFKVEDNEDTM